jgi:hypothetical protein
MQQIYVPERMAREIARLIKEMPTLTLEQIHVLWFKQEREKSKILYPDFRKEG